MATQGVEEKENMPTRRKALSLSPRDYEIARLMSEGLRNKDIGSHMGLATSSVKLYASRMFSKLAISDHLCQRTKVAVMLLRGEIEKEKENPARRRATHADGELVGLTLATCDKARIQAMLGRFADPEYYA
jgi:DNA-binding CsgD family transcriptional regulator